MTQPNDIFKAVGQVGIMSNAPDKLVAFYRDVLGFPLLFETNGMSFFKAGATSLMIGAAHEGQSMGTDVILFFEPEDWGAAEAKLKAAGLAFAAKEQVVQRAPGREHVLLPFRDPEGRPLALLGWRASKN